jgi:hypothetical protein
MPGGTQPMSADEFTELLRELQRRIPFQPFTVELLSGEQFQVDRSDALIIRGGVGAFIAPGGFPWVFDYAGVSRITDGS